LAIKKSRSSVYGKVSVKRPRANWIAKVGRRH
jgi:hypothetical protein